MVNVGEYTIHLKFTQFAPKNRQGPKRKLIFLSHPFFRGYVWKHGTIPYGSKYPLLGMHGKGTIWGVKYLLRRYLDP